MAWNESGPRGWSPPFAFLFLLFVELLASNSLLPQEAHGFDVVTPQRRSIDGSPLDWASGASDLLPEALAGDQGTLAGARAWAMTWNATHLQFLYLIPASWTSRTGPFGGSLGAVLALDVDPFADVAAGEGSSTGATISAQFDNGVTSGPVFRLTPQLGFLGDYQFVFRNLSSEDHPQVAVESMRWNATSSAWELFFPVGLVAQAQNFSGFPLTGEFFDHTALELAIPLAELGDPSAIRLSASSVGATATAALGFVEFPEIIGPRPTVCIIAAPNCSASMNGFMGIPLISGWQASKEINQDWFFVKNSLSQSPWTVSPLSTGVMPANARGTWPQGDAPRKVSGEFSCLAVIQQGQIMNQTAATTFLLGVHFMSGAQWRQEDPNMILEIQSYAYADAAPPFVAPYPNMLLHTVTFDKPNTTANVFLGKLVLKGLSSLSRTDQVSAGFFALFGDLVYSGAAAGFGPLSHAPVMIGDVKVVYETTVSSVPGIEWTPPIQPNAPTYKPKHIVVREAGTVLDISGGTGLGITLVPGNVTVESGAELTLGNRTGDFRVDGALRIFGGRVVLSSDAGVIVGAGGSPSLLQLEVESNGSITRNGHEWLCPVDTGAVVTGVCSFSSASIQLNVTNPLFGPLSFQWSDGSTSQDRISLAPGTYNVSITEANGDSGIGGLCDRSFVVSCNGTTGTTGTTATTASTGTTTAVSITTGAPLPPTTSQSTTAGAGTTGSSNTATEASSSASDMMLLIVLICIGAAVCLLILLVVAVIAWRKRTAGSSESWTASEHEFETGVARSATAERPDGSDSSDSSEVETAPPVVQNADVIYANLEDWQDSPSGANSPAVYAAFGDFQDELMGGDSTISSSGRAGTKYGALPDSERESMVEGVETGNHGRSPKGAEYGDLPIAPEDE